MHAAAGCRQGWVGWPWPSSGSKAGSTVAPTTTRAVNAVMPGSWYTPLLWDIRGLDPVAGRNFGGLPVVDGAVITQVWEQGVVSQEGAISES